MENITIQKLNSMSLKELEVFLKEHNLEVVIERGIITAVKPL